MKKVFIVAAIVICLGAAIFLRVARLEVQHRTPDEKFYTHYGQVFHEHGLKAMPELVRNFNADSNLWTYPPPTRFAYMFLVSMMMKITGETDLSRVVMVSILFSIASLILLIIVGLRFLNPQSTFFALLFMSVSPLELSIAQRAWQDSVVGFTGALLIYFSCEIISDPRRKTRVIPFLVLSAMLFWIKVPSLLVVVLCALWILMIFFFRERDFKGGLQFLALTLVSCGAGFLILCDVSGGFEPIVNAFRNMKVAAPWSDYSKQYTTGPWYSHYKGLWILSPVTAILMLWGFIDMVRLSFKGRLQPLIQEKNTRVVLGIALLTFIFITLVSIPTYYKNLRYLIQINLFLYLMAGFALSRIHYLLNLRLGSRWLRPVTLAVIMFSLGVAWSDYRSYDFFFLKGGVTDPVNRQFEEVLAR